MSSCPVCLSLEKVLQVLNDDYLQAVGPTSMGQTVTEREFESAIVRVNTVLQTHSSWVHGGTSFNFPS